MCALPNNNKEKHWYRRSYDVTICRRMCRPLNLHVISCRMLESLSFTCDGLPAILLRCDLMSAPTRADGGLQGERGKRVQELLFDELWRETKRQMRSIEVTIRF